MSKNVPIDEASTSNNSIRIGEATKSRKKRAIRAINKNSKPMTKEEKRLARENHRISEVMEDMRNGSPKINITHLLNRIIFLPGEQGKAVTPKLREYFFNTSFLTKLYGKEGIKDLLFKLLESEEVNGVLQEEFKSTPDSICIKEKTDVIGSLEDASKQISDP